MIETRTVEIAVEPCESSREAGRKRFLAAMSGEFQGAFVTITSSATAPSGATTDSRLDAVIQARMHLSLEGFTPSKESEDLARRFIAGEIDYIKFSGHRHVGSSQDHA